MRRAQSEEHINNLLKGPGRKLSGAALSNRPRNNSIAGNSDNNTSNNNNNRPKQLASHGSSSQTAVPAPPTRRTSFQKGDSSSNLLSIPPPGSPQRAVRKISPQHSPHRPIRKTSFPIVDQPKQAIAREDGSKSMFDSTTWRLVGIFFFAVGLVALLGLSLGYGERGLRMGQNREFALHHRLLNEAGVSKYELLPDFAETKHVRRVLESTGKDQIRLTLRILDEEIDLNLKRHDDLFSPDYQATRIDKSGQEIKVDSSMPNCAYTASIVGDKDSVGAASLCGGTMQVVMFHKSDPKLSFTVAPIDDKVHVAFRHLSSFDGTNKKFLCATDGDDNHQRLLESALPITTKTATGEKRSLAARWTHIGKRNKTVHFTVVNDLARQKSLGDATEADTITIINTVRAFYSLLYSSTMYGIDIVLHKQITFMDSDGWSTPTDSNNFVDSQLLLNDFASWKASQVSLADSDLVHMFSGREFLGGFVGRAGQAALTEKGVCQVNNCGVIQTSGFDLGLYAKIVTHEMAHGLSLSHDDKYLDPVCRKNTNTFIWSSISLQDGTSWTKCSVNALRDYLDGDVGPFRYGGCLEDAPLANRTMVPTTPTTPQGAQNETGFSQVDEKTWAPSQPRLSRKTATKFPTPSDRSKQSRERTQFPTKSPRQ